MYTAEDTDRIADAISNIDPKGYRILVVLPIVKGVTQGGIHLPDRAVDAERVASCVGYVAKMGPDSYKDTKRFPGGPWCKEGDWVVFKPYIGNRLKSKTAEIELRLINDDAVEAVITRPDDYERI